MQDFKINQIVTLTQADSPWLEELNGELFTIVDIFDGFEFRLFIRHEATNEVLEAYPTMGDTFELAA